MITDTHHCPQCGHHRLEFSADKVFSCDLCKFVFYFNAATAVGGVCIKGDEVLLAVRAFDPGQGLLDFPGGFVDRGESLETALARELKEELSITVTKMTYLTSAANQYLYKNIPYVTCDAYFLCEVAHFEGMAASDDISEFQWVKIDQVRDEDFAFESSRTVMRKLRAGK